MGEEKSVAEQGQDLTGIVEQLLTLLGDFTEGLNAYDIKSFSTGYQTGFNAGYVASAREGEPGINKLRAETERLRERLAALVGDTNAAIMSQYAGYDFYQCAYCDGYADEREDVTHAPDCPIVLGRKALGEGA